MDGPPDPFDGIQETLLARIASGLEETAWAAELCDARWRLVWVSSQLRTLLGEDDNEALGIGSHVVESRALPAWRRTVSDDIQAEWLAENVPQMVEDTPGGRDALSAMVRPHHARLVLESESRRWPIWTSIINSYDVELALGSVRYFGARIRLSDGRQAGTLYLYGSSLPVTLLALVARGDRRMFERMARLVEPGRREAAVLFADVESSTSLSRHLPSATYFRLIRDLMNALDDEVNAGSGIVGKHAGDGLTAFFLASDLGGPSAAAAAAVDIARRLPKVVSAVAVEIGLPDDVPLRLNVGVHWGATLYMGQISTKGRLEVTALGDEVNECARMQQAARDGRVLASKALVERLSERDAELVGLDPDAVAYRPLAELEGVPSKAVRDAGTLAVTELSGPDQTQP
ncbi:MAG: hypothetical protein NVSMB25_00130 [Thermoleophilaceae bacterium]